MTSTRFKILTLNTHLMGGMLVGLKYKDEERRRAIAKYLRTCEADFVGLTELWADAWKDDTINESRYPNFYYPLDPKLLTPYGSGLLNLSKHELYDGSFSEYRDRVGTDTLSQKGFTRATVYLQRDNQPDIRIYIFTTHAQAGNYEKQVNARNENIRQLADVISDLPENSVVVVCGDLNVVGEGPKGNPTQKQYRYLSEQMNRIGLIDAYRTIYPDARAERGATYDAVNNSLIRKFASDDYEEQVQQRLDYVYVGSQTKNVRVESARVVAENVPGTDIPFSDHYGLEVTIEIS